MAEYIEREAVLVGIENEYKNVEKIKTPFAKIIVEGTVEKPYYSILWLDKENKEYNVGYSSYCLDYVFKWMEVVFEIVAADEPLAAEGAPVQKWISVKDRLPEPDHEVLLCTREIETYGKHKEKKKIYRNIYMGYFDGYEWLTFYCYGCEYIFRMNEKFPNETIEVTHWMPSPEPPKED